MFYEIGPRLPPIELNINFALPNLANSIGSLHSTNATC